MPTGAISLAFGRDPRGWILTASSSSHSAPHHPATEHPVIATYIRTPAELAGAVQFGRTTESLVLDFKMAVHDWQIPKGAPERHERGLEAQRETCRDIAQFANTDGGCLLIGVAEQRHPETGIKVAERIATVEEPDGLRQWIEQAIRNYLTPATFSHDIAIVRAAGGVVVAVNVQQSVHVVALWDPPRLEYVRRTSHGKDWMNPDELERHIMNGSRATKLALELAAREASIQGVRVVGGHWMRTPGQQHVPQRWTPQGNVTIGATNERWFELKVRALRPRARSVGLR